MLLYLQIIFLVFCFHAQKINALCYVYETLFKGLVVLSSIEINF